MEELVVRFVDANADTEADWDGRDADVAVEGVVAVACDDGDDVFVEGADVHEVGKGEWGDGEGEDGMLLVAAVDGVCDLRFMGRGL